MEVVGAAGAALARVIVALRQARVVGNEEDGGGMRVGREDAETKRRQLGRLERVALGLRLVRDAAQVPGLVRQRDDGGDLLEQAVTEGEGQIYGNFPSYSLYPAT